MLCLACYDTISVSLGFDVQPVAYELVLRSGKDLSTSKYGSQEFLAETGVMLYQVYKLYAKTDASAYFMHGNNHSFPRYARDLAYAWLDRFLKHSVR